MDPSATVAGMSSLLIQAAQSAAQADGLAPPPPPSSTDLTTTTATGTGDPSTGAPADASTSALGNSQKKDSKGPALRRGKWTPEEEAYASRLIHEFKSGLLPLTDGTTLRTFLSKLLNCDPMRISKKFVGSNCIGKQVFRRRNNDANLLTAEQIQQSRAELSELERRFLERISQSNRGKLPGGGGVVGVGGAAANSAASALALFTAASSTTARTLGDDNSAARMNGSNNNNNTTASSSAGDMNPPSSFPWLVPPLGYKPGNNNNNNNGSTLAAANNNLTTNSRAAAAGRALLGGGLAALMSPPTSTTSNSLSEALERSCKQQQQQVNGTSSSAGPAPADLPWRNSADLLAGALSELQQRASQQNLINAWSESQSNFFQSNNNSNNNNHSGNYFFQSNNNNNNNNSGFSTQAALSQLQQNASAARLANLASSSSMNSLMLKTGLSREQLAQLTGGGGGGGGGQDNSCGLSSSSLSNIAAQRQNSFDALMSLNFQSLQSIDNLANLMQTGNMNQVPETGLKNADFGQSHNGGGGRQLGGGMASAPSSATAPTSEDLNAAARRLASVGRMESLLKSLSSGNMRGPANAAADQGFSSSNANLSNLLQTIQGAASNHNFSAASLLGAVGGGNNSGGGGGGGSGGGGSSQSTVSWADLFRKDSSTGLTALRMQDGHSNRNSSVDDFLSLMASGDIPHQDSSLMNVPFMQQQQQAGNQDAAARLLAQSQILQQAAASRSLGNLAAMAAGQSPSSMSIHQLGLLAAHQQQQQQQESHSKRKLDDLGDNIAVQGGTSTPNKRQF